MILYLYPSRKARLGVYLDKNRTQEKKKVGKKYAYYEIIAYLCSRLTYGCRLFAERITSPRLAKSG